MRKVKCIKLKCDDILFAITLQNWILENSNAGLISIALSKHIRKFVKELKEIPLSEELQ